jgi:hypothetical protein
VVRQVPESLRAAGSTEALIHRASTADIAALLDLISGFYAEGGYPANRLHAARAFADVIGHERLGYVWLLEFERQDVGHVVVTLRYAMDTAA